MDEIIDMIRDLCAGDAIWADASAQIACILWRTGGVTHLIFSLTAF